MNTDNAPDLHGSENTKLLLPNFKHPRLEWERIVV